MPLKAVTQALENDRRLLSQSFSAAFLPKLRRGLDPQATVHKRHVIAKESYLHFYLGLDTQTLFNYMMLLQYLALM